MIAEIFFPCAEPRVRLAARASALTIAVGKEPERELPSQIGGADSEIASVGAGRRSGPPQQPWADPALVVGDGCARQVGAESKQLGWRFDPCGGRDVAVANRRGR